VTGGFDPEINPVSFVQYGDAPGLQSGLTIQPPLEGQQMYCVYLGASLHNPSMDA
jgi:hypothetical protein